MLIKSARKLCEESTKFCCPKLDIFSIGENKTSQHRTFLGEVYWLSATEQTPTKRDAPKFECFLAGKGKHCFRNADEVCLLIMAISSTFCECGAPKLFSAEKYSDPNFCKAGSLNCRTIFLPYLIGHQESLKEHKKIFKSSTSHKIANVEKHLSR